MHRSLLRIVIGYLAGAGLFAALLPAASAEQLITPAEAALPSSPDAGLTLRGITRGPAIEQVEPAPAVKLLHSPLSLKIAFTAHNNTTISPDSVKVTYVKSPMVDLTERLKAHLTPDGIEVKDADLPPGSHLIRIDLKDSQGRASTAFIKLSVQAK